MVESLKELSAKCQKPRYREVGNWMVRNILRDAALPMTWLLLHTPVTANQVTLFSIFVAVGAAVCFALPGNILFLAAALLLQFWYYLDHVDGQIARYRGTACLTGRFFDFVTHHLVHALIIFPMGIYAYSWNENFSYILLGFIGSMGTVMFNLIYDVQYKTLFEKIHTQSTLQIKTGETSSAPAGKCGSSILKNAFGVLHKAHEIHVMMNIITLIAIIQNLPGLETADLRTPLFLFYAALAPFLAFAKTTHFILTRKVDQVYSETFRAG